MPGLETLAVRIWLHGPVHAAGHLGGVVGIVGAGAVDRRGPAHRRQQLAARKRQGLDAAFPRLRGGLVQDALRRSPILEDAEHGRIGALARELGGVEHLVVDHEAGAGAVSALVGREPVAGHLVLLPACGCIDGRSFRPIERSCRVRRAGLSAGGDDADRRAPWRVSPTGDSRFRCAQPVARIEL